MLLDLCVVAGPGIRDLIFPHVERLSVRWKNLNKETILEGVTNRVNCVVRIGCTMLGTSCDFSSVEKSSRDSD